MWLARFDSAPPPPGSGVIDVATIAEACAERFRALAGARSLDLRLERLGTAPATIVAPAEWIDRLAACARRQCLQVRRRRGLGPYRGRAGRPRVVLAVEDTGPGIPQRESVNGCSTGSGAGTDQAGGHGLGLAIADSVVRSTGGRWRVDDASEGLSGARMEVSWQA